MKKLAIVALAFAASLAAATDYSGIWNGKGGIENVKYTSIPQTAQLTLNQSGTSLSGTIKIGNGKPTPISAGTVSGSQLTFAIGNGSGTANLTQNGTQLKGRLTSSKGDIFDIVFSKQ